MAVPKRKPPSQKETCVVLTMLLEAPAWREDKETGEIHRPHHIDLKTGLYRGKQLIEPKGDL